MIKVFIVDDSITTLTFMSSLLENDENIELVGQAQNGEDAVRKVPLIKPDVVIMDINMPKLNGYEATRMILEKYPVPIVICSNIWQPGEIVQCFETIDAGAVTAIPKPPGPGHPDYIRLTSQFVQTVKSMSEVKVVTRKRFLRKKKKGQQAFPGSKSKKTSFEILAIGASTGGPPVIKTILDGLGKDFPLPIVIVQHIAEGFLEGMVSWLDQDLELRVKIAANSEQLQPGYVYLAPNGSQINIKNRKITLNSRAPAENRLCPAVSCFFRSLADHHASETIGVLLTGMGKDGSEELKLLKQGGGMTIAQDEQTSVVHGMPGEAIKIGAVDHILSPTGIIRLLIKTVQ
ncbi:chemotaxis-specific protein-glutamate methyltransferase CheB [Candidatus Pacearchaeota archaeon]|nr:chemotaxis-specific protein-glutamate methyltransferase CheB [Candidatus Pacearchaeota archaeon]